MSQTYSLRQRGRPPERADHMALLGDAETEEERAGLTAKALASKRGAVVALSA